MSCVNFLFTSFALNFSVPITFPYRINNPQIVNKYIDQRQKKSVDLKIQRHVKLKNILLRYNCIYNKKKT